jgi:uracil phosphoribosyltransferase
MKRLLLIAASVFNCGCAIPHQMMESLIYKIRDPMTQKKVFRESLEKIGELLAIEVLEDLECYESKIETLTNEIATHSLLVENPVLITILRAGLPLNQGVMTVFPEADVGFIAMARNEKTLKSNTSYTAFPELENKIVIVTDTMLATGGSLIDAINMIKAKNPSRIYVLAAMASKPGLDRILKACPYVKIIAACVDPALNEKGFIIPGLGDAGDRAFGKKNE